MALKIQPVKYFYATVKDQPGEAYKLLALLADMGINQHAFTAVPVGPNATQLAIFPEDTFQLLDEAKKAGMALNGPYQAFLVQGDDELGALVDIHLKLYDANVNVYASTGVTDGKGSFGYLIYVKEEDFSRAAAALGLE